MLDAKKISAELKSGYQKDQKEYTKKQTNKKKNECTFRELLNPSFLRDRNLWYPKQMSLIFDIKP